MTEQEQAVQTRQHRRLVAKLSLLTVGMFAFGFALVPLYDIFCEITGVNGKTGRVSAAEVTDPDINREVTVKFVASVNSSAPWEFKPTEATMVVHPGGLYSTQYYAKNKTGMPRVAQAAPSVSPREASLYFNKTECFCFTKQSFMAEEGRDMPVQFIIDRDLPKNIDTVILSYTFFDITAKTEL